MTPILCAAKNKHQTIVDFLAENGASVNIRDYTGAKVQDFVSVNALSNTNGKQNASILGTKEEFETGFVIDDE